jgi:hypothetical protein
MEGFDLSMNQLILLELITTLFYSDMGRGSTGIPDRAYIYIYSIQKENPNIDSHLESFYR